MLNSSEDMAQSGSQEAQVLTAAGNIVPNTFTLWEKHADLPTGDVLMRVGQTAYLNDVTGRKGLLLTINDSPEDLKLPLNELDLIAIEFEGFGDGRGYSFATLLRRQGFKGELRAVGDVFKDVLYYLKRCGFDSFELKPGKDLEDAKAGLTTFTAGYQATIATPDTHYQAGRKLS